MHKLRTASAWILSLAVLTASHAQDAPSPEFLSSGKLASNLPFSEAVRIDNLLLLSGQIGAPPGTTRLVPGGMKEEARQAMTNIRMILEAHGYAMTDLVKCTVMLADMSQWAAFNEVYRTFFDKRFPARSAFGANGLALGAQVEVECIAYRAR
jgi:2-iminobutanoate/2-iminopropanoate deaminase